MNQFRLYRGVWPGNVSRTAKYTVRQERGEWRVKVLAELERGMFYFAVDNGDSSEIIRQVNEVKSQLGTGKGGAFYLNEYGHLIVPVMMPNGETHYYFAGKIHDKEFEFYFENERLTNKPVGKDGRPLELGNEWIGPRPGIPYVLAAGGKDIRLKLRVFTDDDPPTIKRDVELRVQLSKVLNSDVLLNNAIKPISDIKGDAGGRFYVNEHGVIFAPLTSGDGDGINYVYCGQIDRSAWFPEPITDS